MNIQNEVIKKWSECNKEERYAIIMAHGLEAKKTEDLETLAKIFLALDAKFAFGKRNEVPYIRVHEDSVEQVKYLVRKNIL